MIDRHYGKHINVAVLHDHPVDLPDTHSLAVLAHGRI